MSKNGTPTAPGIMILVTAVAILLLTMASEVFGDTTGYTKTNLVSDVAGFAQTLDPNLKNPWGMTSSSLSPNWVSDQGTGVATLYTGSGTVVPLVVTIPGSSSLGGPTGVVFNPTTDFNGAPFIFATLDGTIATWSGGSTAVTGPSVGGAVFTGLTEGNNGSGNFLYAADFAGGGIVVFDKNLTRTTLSGSFIDPTLPAGYSPYNVRVLNGKLYVEFVPMSNGNPIVGAGNGIVDVFDLNGNFQQRLVTGGPLNDPWGIAIAPVGFGTFSNDLLVGNSGNGEINAFDLATGTFLGTLENAQGQPIVSSGLWTLNFGNGGNGGGTDTLFFTAGINGQRDGLYGSISAGAPIATPESPSSYLIVFGILALGLLRLRSREVC